MNSEASQAHVAPRWRAWAAVLLIIALVFPLYSVISGAVGEEGQQASAPGTEECSSASAPTQHNNEGVPFEVVDNLKFFDTKLMLDPKVDISGFTVQVSGTEDYEQGLFGAEAPLHNDDRAPLGRYESAREKKYQKFGEDPASSIVFGSYEAAEAATITATYPVIGSYEGRPVGMRAIINGIDAERSYHLDYVDSHPGVEAIADLTPTLQIAAHPQNGIYFWNMHSANFLTSLFYADDGSALNADDVYLTQSSLSVWNDHFGNVAEWNGLGGVDIVEMTKPTTAIEAAYFIENTNMSTNTGSARHVETPSEANGYTLGVVEDEETGYYYGFGGEDQKANPYTDTVGHETFPRNAVSFKYAGASNMGFKNMTTSNTMWFTLYPQALTNARPPAPAKSDKVAPVKAVYGAGEEVAEAEGHLPPGSAVEYTIDQQVNVLGSNSIVRYENFSIVDTVPDAVAITGYQIVNDAGEDVSAYGQWLNEGQTVAFAFNADYLASGMPMNGEHYYLKIQGVVRDGVQSGTEISNYAVSRINHRPEADQADPCASNARPTNTVSAKVLSADDSHSHVDLTNRSDVFTYTVSGRIPADAVTATITDTLEPVLEVVEASANIAGATVSVDGNTVTASLADGYTDLEKIVTAHRGEMFTLTIKAKVRADASEEVLTAYLTEGRVDVPNTGTVAFNDNPATTNTVTVTPPPEDPEKAINGQKEPVSLEGRYDTFTYTVAQKIPAGAVNVVFTDTLEDVLEFADKGELSVEGDIAIDGQTITATIADATAYAGTEVTLTFAARIRDGVSDETLIAKYGDSRQVPNKATVSIDGTPRVTNEVLVTPPDDPRKDPAKEVNGAKDTVNEAGERVADVTLAARDEVFTYTISQEIPQSATSATFTDTLEDVLEFVGEPTIDGKASYTVNVEGQKLTVSTDDVRADRGAKVTLTFQARIKADVSDKELIAKYGSTDVPNKAEVAINGQGKATNDVLVTPPTPEPEKFVNGSKGKVALAERPDTFTYTIAQQIPARAANVVFTDTLEDVLEVVGTPKLSAAGDVNVNGQTVTATIADASALAGEEVTLTIVAKLREGVSDEQLIAAYGTTTVPNRATVAINNNPKTTNEVLVTPPSEPEKLINGQKELVTLGAFGEEFTYTVLQRIPEGAVNVVFTDTLEDVLEIVGTPAIDAIDGEVNVDGQKVTATIADASSLEGQVVTLTIKAKIRQDADLRPYADSIVPNTATVSIDDKPRLTNEVLVTPPDEPREDPVKKVNNTTRVELDGRYKEFTYTVSQKIPANANTASFTDTLEDVLDVVGKPSIDGKAKYEVSVDGQKVTATATDVRADRGATVTLTIKARLKDGVSDEQLIAKYGSTDVPNTASVAIDGNGKTTNTVIVTPPGDPRDEPVKKVNGSTDTVKLAARDEIFTYTVSQKIPQAAITANFADTLEDVLEFVGEPTIDGAANYEVNIEGQTITAHTTNVRADRGNVVTLTFQAKVKASVSDEQLVALYGASLEIPNTANVAIDGKGKATNTVRVAPPVGSVRVQYVSEDGTVLKDWEFVQRNKVEGTQYATEQLAFDGYEFVKLAEDSAEATGTVKANTTLDVIYVYRPLGSVRVEYVSEDGTVLEPWADVEKDKPAGTEYVTEQKEFPGYEFVQVDPENAPAEGTVESGKTLDVIYIYKPIETEPVKAVNGSVEAVALSERDETFTYTVSQVIPGGAKNVVFTDTLEDVLEVVGTPTIDAEGAIVAVEGQKVSASIQDATGLAGQNVTLTIEAKIREDVSDSELIERYGSTVVPNVAEVSIDGKGKVTNEVFVNPPTRRGEVVPEPEITKLVNKARHADLASADEVFTYDISALVTDDAVKVVITDTLVDELEFAGEATVSVNGAPIEADVVVEGQSLTVSVDPAIAFQGQNVVVSFDARIREGADLAKYGPEGEEKVPNVASYVLTRQDGSEVATDSNTVTVTPPVKPAIPPTTPPATPKLTPATPATPLTPIRVVNLPRTGSAAGMGIVLMALLGGGGAALVGARRRES